MASIGRRIETYVFDCVAVDEPNREFKVAEPSKGEQLLFFGTKFAILGARPEAIRLRGNRQ